MGRPVTFLLRADQADVHPVGQGPHESPHDASDAPHAHRADTLVHLRAQCLN
jgi:hypothetical protein